LLNDARISTSLEQKCDASAPLSKLEKEAFRMADEVIMGYCVKEKAQKQMKDAQPVTLKNGKSAIKGVCSSCGTKMMKFVSTKKVDPAASVPAPAHTESPTPPPAKIA
jgi:hypothetical protein